MGTSSTAKDEEIKDQVQEGWESKLSAFCSEFVVLFDSIAGLCFHKRQHFLSLCNQCVFSYTFSMTCS